MTVTVTALAEATTVTITTLAGGNGRQDTTLAAATTVTRTLCRRRHACNVQSVRCVRRTVISAALVAAIASQTGCGSPTYTSSSDPAKVTPASARLFLSLAVRPPGGAHSISSRDLQGLTHLEHPFAKLAEQLLPEGPWRGEYTSQIEPWVGNRAGLFLTTLPTHLDSLLGGVLDGLPLGMPGATQQGTLIFDVRDVPRARASLARLARQQGEQATRYRGVSFYASPTGRAQGIVANFAVIGSRTGFEAVVDTAYGASSLERAAGSRTTPEALASAYVAPAAHSGALLAGVHRVWLSVAAATGSLSLQGELTVEHGYQPLFGVGGARELQALPGGSWLALGTGDLGATLPRWLELLGGISSHGASSMLGSLGASGVSRVLGTLSSASGELEEQFARWAGPAGVYVSGSGLLELQAALVVDSHNPAASRAAVGKLASILRSAGAIVANVTSPGTSAAASVRIPGFPAILYIVSTPNELVIGLGPSSVAGAIQPRATLAGSQAYTTAASALGEGVQPSAIVEFPQLLSLLEAIGVTQSSAFANVAPYLKSLGTLTVGSSEPRALAPGLSTIHFRANVTLSG
jgi:hypothetical protein